MLPPGWIESSCSSPRLVVASSLLVRYEMPDGQPTDVPREANLAHNAMWLRKSYRGDLNVPIEALLSLANL